MRDRFRDPRGWLLDALPWPLRRLYLAAQTRSWPPDSARLIAFRRPPEHVFEAFRRLHGIEDDQASGPNREFGPSGSEQARASANSAGEASAVVPAEGASNSLRGATYSSDGAWVSLSASEFEALSDALAWSQQRLRAFGNEADADEVLGWYGLSYNEPKPSVQRV